MTAGPAWAAWVEQSALAQAIRGGAAFYPAIEAVHILGFACLLGAIVVFDLRLIGLGGGIRPAALAAIALPVAGIGLVVAMRPGHCCSSPRRRPICAIRCSWPRSA